jgi:hypothetical protein
MKLDWLEKTELTEMLRLDIGLKMLEIEDTFRKYGLKTITNLTLVARDPDNDNMYIVLTNDDLGTVTEFVAREAEERGKEQSMKYRKKPVVIEAMQIPPPGYQYAKLGERLETWLRSNGCNFSIRPDAYILIHTLEGTMEGRPGDWIIRGVKGEFYPCKSDIFEATYEAVE